MLGSEFKAWGIEIITNYKWHKYNYVYYTDMKLCSELKCVISIFKLGFKTNSSVDMFEISN